MKNCDPFVSGPEFAIASRPATSKFSAGIELILKHVAGIALARAQPDRRPES